MQDRNGVRRAEDDNCARAETGGSSLQDHNRWYGKQ
jgi:hypothetical protein